MNFRRLGENIIARPARNHPSGIRGLRPDRWNQGAGCLFAFRPRRPRGSSGPASIKRQEASRWCSRQAGQCERAPYRRHSSPRVRFRRGGFELNRTPPPFQVFATQLTQATRCNSWPEKRGTRAALGEKHARRRGGIFGAIERRKSLLQQLRTRCKAARHFTPAAAPPPARINRLPPAAEKASSGPSGGPQPNIQDRERGQGGPPDDGLQTEPQRSG